MCNHWLISCALLSHELFNKLGLFGLAEVVTFNHNLTHAVRTRWIEMMSIYNFKTPLSCVHG